MFGGADACPCWALATFGSKINVVMANSSTIHRSGPERSARGKIRKENSFHRGVTPAPAYKRPETQSTALNIVMPGFMPGIHALLVAKTWMAPELGLARVPHGQTHKSATADL